MHPQRLIADQTCAVTRTLCVSLHVGAGRSVAALQHAKEAISAESYIERARVSYSQRSYYRECTASRPLSEVKRGQALLVL